MVRYSVMLVLALARAVMEVVGVDVLEPDEGPPATVPAAFAFSMKPGILMAERVDLE